MVKNPHETVKRTGRREQKKTTTPPCCIGHTRLEGDASRVDASQLHGGAWVRRGTESETEQDSRMRITGRNTRLLSELTVHNSTSCQLLLPSVCSAHCFWSLLPHERPSNLGDKPVFPPLSSHDPQFVPHHYVVGGPSCPCLLYFYFTTYFPLPARDFAVCLVGCAVGAIAISNNCGLVVGRCGYVQSRTVSTLTSHFWAACSSGTTRTV